MFWKKIKNALNRPVIQDVILVDAKKAELKFSRLVLLEDKNILNKGNYIIYLNGERVDIKAITIAQRDVEVRQNTKKNFNMKEFPAFIFLLIQIYLTKK